MGILSWIILGLIAGFIGSKIVNRQGQGFWLDILLGIIGAFVGGYLFSFFGKEGVTGLNLYSMLVAVAGSVVVLLIYNLVPPSLMPAGAREAGRLEACARRPMPSSKLETRATNDRIAVT